MLLRHRFDFPASRTHEERAELVSVRHDVVSGGVAAAAFDVLTESAQEAVRRIDGVGHLQANGCEQLPVLFGASDLAPAHSPQNVPKSLTVEHEAALDIPGLDHAGVHGRDEFLNDVVGATCGWRRS